MNGYADYMKKYNTTDTDSEFDNFLKGGSNIKLEGGFPMIYESENTLDNEMISTDKKSRKQQVHISNNNIHNILDNRRKTPFLNVDIVNSDSVQDVGFLKLFDTDVSSQQIIDTQLGGLSEVKNISDSSTIQTLPNIEVVSIDLKQSTQIEELSMSDSIQLPQNIEVINRNSQVGGDCGKDHEEELSMSDSIQLPQNIEVITRNSQVGGDCGEDHEEISMSDSVQLPLNIEIVTRNSQVGGHCGKDHNEEDIEEDIEELSMSDSVQLLKTLDIISLE